MRILVVNDDGIAAPGLWALAEALTRVGNVVVVAPDREQSGVGCSVTLHVPVRATEVPSRIDGVEAHAVEGTPGDSVVLATSTLVKEPIDLIVSGINSGSNLGHDVFVSGTLGAAFHGYFRGIPSIGISVTALTDVRFDVAAHVAVELAQKIREGTLSRNLLLNVNLPNKPTEQLRGIAVTCLAGNSYSEVVEPGRDIRRPFFWIKRSRPSWTVEEGTDIWATQNDYISITPLHTNLTHHELAAELEKLDLSLNHL